MKKICLAFGMLVSYLLLLSSCFPGYDLTSTAMVQAFGIDRAPDGSYDVTLQIFASQGAGGVIAMDPSVNNASVITVNGQSISQAVDLISTMQSEYPFMGQNRMIILGREIASQEGGIPEIFHYFERNQLTRPNVEILMADKTAREIVEINMRQGLIAVETIENTLKNSAMRGNVVRSAYLPLVQSMYLNDGAGFAPVIAKKEEEKEEEKEGGSDTEAPAEENPEDADQIMQVDQILINQMALFKHGGLVDVLDETQSKGLLLLKNKLDQRILMLTGEEDPSQRAVLNLYRCRTKIRPEICGGKITFVMAIEGKATVEELHFGGNSMEDRDRQWREITTLCNQKLEHEVVDTFETVIRKNQCDILGLQRLIQRKDPALWQEISKDFEGNMGQFSVRVESNIQIDRIGVDAI